MYSLLLLGPVIKIIFISTKDSMVSILMKTVLAFTLYSIHDDRSTCCLKYMYRKRV